MNLESFRKYCLQLPAVTEDMPFGPEVLAFRVAGKIFALADTKLFASINLKCDPEIAIDLRERHPAVQPGYHMNKKHWNTILMDGTIADWLLLEWTHHSYQLIYKSLNGKQLKENGLA